MADVALRSMQIADIARARTLWQQSDGVGLRPLDDSAGAIEKFVAHNQGLSYVAIHGDDLVGAVLCGTDGRRGYLHHLAVRHDMRRSGIGRQLVTHVVQALRELGVSKASIDVFADNPEALAFWQRVGFFSRPDVQRMSFIVES